ncbi:hypothetical protein [Bacillus taeanensis]|uniref:Uncharacterized protein n=1 Tax=Bacillus taeanensis TaxID=273032 RepID=A0A366XW73_9BACI|nr:hypothetical protein [Bacillus taeanensis]RBW70147.1 hypothetical protein DS031_08125 [Bacillus taeanensis]
MAFDVKDLGLPYHSLDAAAVDKSPSEVVITDSSENAYYIIEEDAFENGPKQEGYKIVVNAGE